MRSVTIPKTTASPALGITVLFFRQEIDFFFGLFAISWAALTHMEVPRLGVELELQPLAYAKATAMQDLQPTSQLTAVPDP